MHENSTSPEWKTILNRLAEIRDQQDYSAGNVDFIRDYLQSADDRIRGGAALAAAGCIFEPYILDLLLELAETDSVDAIRKATIQTLGQVIHEGVDRNMEDQIGADTDMEHYEEWDDLQNQTLQEDYLRVKNLLLSILQDDFEHQELRDVALTALGDLGFLLPIQEIIRDFIDLDNVSSKQVALNAMGKYPQHWTAALADYLDPALPKSLILEAISSSYASHSRVLAAKIEKLLATDDPDILSFGLLTLANINQTENLGDILQKFSLSQNEQVRQAAQQAINNIAKANFSDFLHDELGFEE